MKRILLGLVTIVGAVSAIYIGTTGAFFSDTETSLANLFTAGELDLLVDNDSYYNGNRCVLVDLTDDQQNNPAWVWQGPAGFPEPGTACDTSWPEANLNNGIETLHKFFNFNDVKPDDDGEDTISLHVQNDAWMCMEVSLTSNDDVDCTTPENDALTGENGACNDPDADEWDGELAGLIQMVWWADDGDNVLEEGEPVLSDGVETLFGLATTTPFSVALADSQNNAWGEPVGTPVPGGDNPVYIAKAWCFGTLVATPVEEDQGNPITNPGYTCDGTGINNAAQTDQATLDVAFEAVQARHNSDFLCDEPDQCSFTVGANLITNGGFEAPEVSTAQNWNIFDVGDAIPGWTVEWRDAGPTVFGPQNRPTDAQLELHENVLGTAFEGDQYAELDSDWLGPTNGGTGEPASITIYQDIVTVPGATYHLKFVWAARPITVAGNNRLETKWDGVVVDDTGTLADPNAGIQWIERTIVLTATDALTRVQFTDLGTANSEGTFLDKVQLYQVTCPNTAAPVELLAPQGFETDNAANDIADWEEEGAEGDASTNAILFGADAPEVGAAASPAGGRFARIGQNEWICRPVVTTGYHGLLLKYFWRGDNDAEPDTVDFGHAEYATSGTCDSATWTAVTAHELDDAPEGGEGWSALQSVGVGDGATLIRFRQVSSAADEHFRVDGVSVTGIPN